MDLFMHNMGLDLLQICPTYELQARNSSSENQMDVVSLETSPVHLAKYVSIIRSIKNVLIFCAQPLHVHFSCAWEVHFQPLSSVNHLNSFHQPRNSDWNQPPLKWNKMPIKWNVKNISDDIKDQHQSDGTHQRTRKEARQSENPWKGGVALRRWCQKGSAFQPSTRSCGEPCVWSPSADAEK